LRTRKATGYYKVPTLKGLWYRSPLEHSGSVASLEEWFDLAYTIDELLLLDQLCHHKHMWS